MLQKSRLIAIGMISVMLLAAFAVMSGSVAAEERADGEPLPEWDPGTKFWYRFDDTDLEEYTLIGINYQDGGGNQFAADLICTPDDDATQHTRTVSQVQADSYSMSTQLNSWENGTWESVVDDLDPDEDGQNANVNIGDVVASGDYTYDASSNGQATYNKQLNHVSGTSSETLEWDFTGDHSFAFTVENDVTESTSNGANTVYKPTWDQEPMDVGDSWSQTNTYTQQVDQSWEASGDLSGGNTASWTYNFYRDYDWTVASESSKTINQIRDGTNNNFPSALKITRSGSFDWDYDDGTNTDSGTVTPGPYEYWYAGEGDKFDGGWTIEYNQSTRMIWSTYEAFINTAPQLDSSPPAEVEINEDQQWEFINGQDYAVSDPDPDAAGEITYSISAELDGDSSVLSDLSIDETTGDITFTPTQEDVADGYEVIINATDNYDKNPLSLEIPFTLDIKNTNDAPEADSTVMTDFEMDEGEEKMSTNLGWGLDDVFSDPDMEENPLNDDNPYDPDESLTYSVTNNGSIRVKCGSEDLSVSNQCSGVTFEAIDGEFPRDLPVAMTFTASDSEDAKANDQVTITVKHVNHAPTPNAEAEDTYEMDEDTTETVNLKDYFNDIDVGDPQYPTSDSLNYDKDGEQHLKITITGSKAKIEPDADWNGEEEITFEATDKSGASAEFDLTIQVDPVNDAPVVDDYDPDGEPVLDETDDATETGDMSTQIFSVVASDVDITTGQSDVLTYNWTIEDGDTGEVFEVSSHDAEYTFETAFDGEFSEGYFHGGESSKTYIVTVIVSDGKVDADDQDWYVTVNNVNRAPSVTGIDVSKVKGDGTATPETPKSPGNYSFGYANVYRLDATNYVSDPDEDGIDDLTFEWSSDKDGVIGTSASIDVGAGKAKGTASVKLKPGKHIMTLRVTDNDGGSDEFTFTVKVASDDAGSPGFEAVVLVGAMGATVAILAYKRKNK